MKFALCACLAFVVVGFVFGLRYVFNITYGIGGIFGFVLGFGVYCGLALTLVRTIWTKAFSN